MNAPRRTNAGAMVTAGLVAVFRIVAVCIAAPLVIRAIASGQWLAALLTVAVLVALCQAAGDAPED